MGIMIKHSLKNIFAKPMRLLVLLVCVIFASFTGLLAIDMSNNINSLLRGYAMDMLGTMDVIVTNSSSDILEGVNDTYDITAVGITFSTQYEYSHDSSNYAYSFEENISVDSFSDIEDAFAMSVFPETENLDDTTAIVTKEYADNFEVSEGDTITLQTRDEQIIELTVIKIVDINNSLLSGNDVIVTNEISRRIMCVPELDYQIWLVDVHNDSQVTAVTEMLRSNDPKADIESMDDMLQADGIEQIYYLFYLLFLISFLLVVFVTMSLAEKIVNERMSVIGTLRSLGVSQGRTAFVLLIENALYAIIGGVIGCVLYNIIKPTLFSTVFTIDINGETDIKKYLGATPIYIYLIVILGAMLIECAYPLYELLKAVKTPIRDIIFNNKDTEFKYKWTRLYIGAGLAVLSIIMAFLTKNFITMAVSLVSGVVALAMLIPFLIRICSRGLSALFHKTKLPVAQLASENISRNKIIMGTAVLCITTIILSLLIGGVGNALTKNLVTPDYNCDILVFVYYSDEDHGYRFIDNIDSVTETDYIYGTSLYAAVNDNEKVLNTIWADTPHTMFSELPAEGFGLSDNEMILTEPYAQSLGLSVGDEFTVAINADTDFPNVLTFVLADTIAYGDNSALLGSKTMIISKDLYDHLFDGSLEYIFAKTDDPEGVKTVIENNVESNYVRVQTYEELKTEYETQANGLIMVLRLVVAGSVALTLIGIAGNQALGFVTRKRETALLYSVAMSRRKLRRLLFLESLFSMGLSGIIAAIAAPFLYNVLGHLFDLISGGDLNILANGSINPATMFTYLGIILLVFLLTTLTPIRHLRKMNIAEELKYE